MPQLIIDRFRIKSRLPAIPQGPFVYHYSKEDDILWVGKACECTGENCIHANGEMIEVEKDVVVTINKSPMGEFVSSLALIHASQHKIWQILFRAMDEAVREKTISKLTINCDWFSTRFAQPELPFK